MARILDLTGLSGAYGARLLIEMGHDVIRVEPTCADDLRRLGPFLGGEPHVERGAFHQFLNAGKQSLALNLQCRSGRRIFTDLLNQVDALLAPSPLPCEDEVRASISRGLVVVEIVDDDEPELCAYARAGLLSLTGYPGREPRLLGGHAAYALTGLYVALAATVGLLNKEITGAGSTESVSVIHGLETAVEQAVTEFLFTGNNTERRGAGGQVSATSGAFPCRDGYWIVSLGQSPEAWSRFTSWSQDSVLAADPTWSDEANRQANKDLIQSRIREWSRQHDKVALVEEAQSRHLPSSPVSTPAELADDAQLLARGFLQEMRHPELGPLRAPRGALATVLGTEPGPAPRLGEHNHQILTELGYSVAEHEALIASGAM